MLLHLTDPTPPPPASGLVVGIDLGTTHSVVAVVKDNEPHTLTFGHKSPLIPSTLSLDKETLKVGGEGEETLRSTKRFMQTPLRPLTLGNYSLSPLEAASAILAHLKALVETLSPLESAVITVPAYFDEAARIATKQAAALAGIKVLRLINEPTAAALAYGLKHGSEGLYAVYDFGGGTFDLSILKLTKGVFQVLATSGDLHLGGDDIDRTLAEAKGLSLLQAREVKERLTEQPQWKGILRTELEKLADPFISKTLDVTERVFKDAHLSPLEVQGIVLVGGMTRMPAVRSRLEAFFKKPPLTNINPDEAVALGAALSAHSLVQGSETLLLDVTPLSLGLETQGGLVEKILPRNTPLPALATQDFTTQQDGQGGMVIHVVQGEREFAKDCRSLARFELSGLPARSAGRVRVSLSFTVDAEGLLTVTALEKTTGLLHHIEVYPSEGLTAEALKEMIRDSKKHGRQDIEDRLKVETQLQGPSPHSHDA